MFRGYFALILSTIFMVGCSRNSINSSCGYGIENQIDSLIENGANPYDVASYLHSNRDYLDVKVAPSQNCYYTVCTSEDGEFRVYSIFDWPSSSIRDSHNIFHYRNGRDDDAIHIKADAGDWGYIRNIGMIQHGDKSYYILISEYYSIHQGVFYTAMVSVYSLDKYIYDSLTRESIFVTKSGRHTDMIEVSWQDDHGDKDDSNLFGISFDDAKDTHEVYVQVIDAKTGNALDRAIVYRWNGKHFVFAEIRPMRIERTEE